MSYEPPQEIRVSVDVGCHRHSVAIGLANGDRLDMFEIDHHPEGFREFFARIEQHRQPADCPVAVAMEGYNGYARPLDALVRARGYRLYNVNNLKLARFKEIFPAAAKTDEIDACKGLELFQLRDHLPLAKGVLQEVAATPRENTILKRLTRRRRRLVNERVRILNALQADLQAVCPGLLALTNDAGNLWFLRLLTSASALPKLARLRPNTIRKIRGVGAKYASLIQAWQPHAQFSEDVAWVGAMIQDDAARVLALDQQIKALEAQIDNVATDSTMATLLSSLPGFGPVSTASLAGEVGTVARFGTEASLALYLGMANLDHSSGRSKGSKAPIHVNTRAKAAMMVAVDRHRKQVPESRRYYEKKRTEGKGHNQAIRALGRHLCRVIYTMLTKERAYQLRD